MKILTRDKASKLNKMGNTPSIENKSEILPLGNNTFVKSTTITSDNHTYVEKDTIHVMDMPQTRDLIFSTSNELIEKSNQLIETADKEKDELQKTMTKSVGYTVNAGGVILKRIGEAMNDKIGSDIKKCDETCKTIEELKQCYHTSLGMWPKSIQ